MDIAITAGLNRARHVVILAEALRRRGVKIAGILIVSPFQTSRLKRLVRNRGWASARSAISRVLGIDGLIDRNKAEGPISEAMKSREIGETTITAWTRRHHVRTFNVSSLNDPRALDILRSLEASGVVYGGGGILGEQFLKIVNRRVISAHSGPLPAIRGMNACEWSLLLGEPPTVTIHFIDRGVDTGSIIEKLAVVVQPGDTVSVLREKCALIGVDALARRVDIFEQPYPTQPNAGKLSRQCFVLAPVLKELLEVRLANFTPRRIPKEINHS